MSWKHIFRKEWRVESCSVDGKVLVRWVGWTGCGCVRWVSWLVSHFQRQRGFASCHWLGSKSARFSRPFPIFCYPTLSGESVGNSEEIWLKQIIAKVRGEGSQASHELRWSMRQYILEYVYVSLGYGLEIETQGGDLSCWTKGHRKGEIECGGQAEDFNAMTM